MAFETCTILRVARTSRDFFSQTTFLTSRRVNSSPRPEAFRFSPVARKDLQTVQSGERTNAAGKPVGNKILLSIPDSEYSSVRPHLEYVLLPSHLVLHEAGGRLEFAYFLNRGLISLVVVMKDGRTAEAGIVGNEGFTGTQAVVGLSRGPLRGVMQITGEGFRG